MATPSKDFVFDPNELRRLAEEMKPNLSKTDYTKPYRVGERNYHKSPGHRSSSEVWYHPNKDGYGGYETHYQYEHIWTAEFWQEVEIVTRTAATVEELRHNMAHLDAKAIAEGYAHYYDKYIWEDDSERIRRLMEAFEAEHKAPAGTRMFDKISMFDFKEKLMQNVYNEIQIPNIILAA